MKFFINFLTFFRLFSGPMIFSLFGLSFHPKIAFVLFLIAGLSDYFDGYLAREGYSFESVFEVMDPITWIKSLLLFLLLALILYFESIFIALVGGVILSREFWVSALRDLNARNKNYGAAQR